MTENTADRPVVVGVDGSEASVAALRWAGEQARALGTGVLAVHAWEPAAGLAPYAPASGRPTEAEQREAAAGLLAAAVRTAFGARVGTGVRAVLVEGPPARVLLRHARGAALLALGRGDHGRWDRPALGAVGRECLRHAPVPVVTVPAPERVAAPLRSVGGAFSHSGAA
ncbi:universal stress protein [Streptomyces sp. NPDC002766]|uniref:universal stress protein n=1 Tax=unclassified Streptomyces TaxID=2593676 RepID=UPI003320A2F5